MRSINYVIIEVEDAYNNEKEFGDVKLVVNSTIESVEHINRIAKVIAAPDCTILKEGDEVVVHHNICRLRRGTKGEVVQSDFHIEGNRYYVPLSEVFMYKRDDKWNAISPYCFVKPIKVEDKEDGVLKIIDSSDSHKGMVQNMGVVKYGNDILKMYDVEEGDTVWFSDYSEYEFEIDGELLYKMSFGDLLMKVV